MWQIVRQHPRAVLAAITAHLLFVVLLGISLDWSGSEANADKGRQGKDIEIIKARAVDEAKIQAQINRLRKEEQRRKQAQQEKIEKVRQARLKEERRLAAIKKKQEQEKKRLAELKKKKQELEKKRKLEEQRIAEIKKEQEKKRKEEEAKKEQQQAEAELKQKMAAEQKQREQQQRELQAKQLQGSPRRRELDKYRSLIKADVSRNWNIPSTAKSGMVCEVRVRLIPSGDVVSVQIIKSSGDSAFDQSVEAAVYRAAPLPVPPAEFGLFDDFREVIFSFDQSNRIQK